MISSMLDKEPRWLRPRDRDEMDDVIQQTRKCTKRRQDERVADVASKTTNSRESLGQRKEEDSKYSDSDIDLLQSNCLEGVPDMMTDVPVELDRIDSEFYRDSTANVPILWALHETVTHADILTMKSKSHSRNTITTKSESTKISFSSLGKRLSSYPSSYVKDIARLVKVESVSDGSIVETSPVNIRLAMGTNAKSSVNTPSMGQSMSHAESSTYRRPLMASEILSLDRLLIDDRFDCYREKLGSIANWIDDIDMNTGEIYYLPVDWYHLRLSFKDAFGHTVLHFLAARGADMILIVDALSRGPDVNSRNTSGQTFLHLLTIDWLQALDLWEADLFNRKLVDFGVDIFAFDMYGRGFVDGLPVSSKLYWLVVGMYPEHIASLPLRDAFGTIRRSGTAPESTPVEAVKSPHQTISRCLAHKDYQNHHLRLHPFETRI
jgi:hypothetical protein